MAPKTSKKKGSKSKPRSTSSKVANKKQNKFAKQGKLRKQRLKQKKKENKQNFKVVKETTSSKVNGTQSEDDDYIEDDDALQEEDVEFYAEQDTAFTSSVLPRKNLKRKHEELHEDDSSKYEKKARMQFSGDNSQRLKMLLPIKDKGKVIPKMMELEDSEPEEEELPPAQQNEDDDIAAESEKENTPLPQLSCTEILALRQEKLDNRKQRIAELATAVIENPEENMAKMKELRKLLGEKDPDVCLTVRKLVMMSMCEIFKDIIPGYRLRLPTAQEKEQKMKQDTKKLMDFEAALLLSYKTYLEFLEHTITGKSFDNSLRMKRLGFCDVSFPQESKKDVVLLAVQCMCTLLTTHPHFNYRSDVVTFLVPYMNHRNTQLSDTVCKTAKKIFVADKSGETTLEVVKAIAKLVKSRKFNIQPKVLETLLCLKIKEINTEKTAGSRKMKKKEKFLKFSRRERKKLKQEEELEKELRETKATQDKELQLKMHTQIVETMFTMFFNVLKQEDKSPLLPVVLEGLAKFTHLISVDFFHDLYAVFNKLIEAEELSQVEVLHCVQTAFRILGGQGAALNIDPMKFYTHLYNALLSIHAGSSPENAADILDTVDAAIVRRKKQVTQQRVLAFIKRLTTMSLHQLPQASAAYLAIARCVVSMFPYADGLYDQEVEGSGMYMPYLREPEHCHANSAVLWELHSMKKHYHPDVRRLANALLQRSAGQGDLSQKTPPEVYQYVQSREPFPASLPSRVKKHSKVSVDGFRSQAFEEELHSKFPGLFSH